MSMCVECVESRGGDFFLISKQKNWQTRLFSVNFPFKIILLFLAHFHLLFSVGCDDLQLPQKAFTAANRLLVGLFKTARIRILLNVNKSDISIVEIPCMKCALICEISTYIIRITNDAITLWIKIAEQ